jgi:hypothetical protein
MLPAYSRFNKHVLFLAKDAVVSIGFTGLAHVEGVPTDAWIAEVLSGRPGTAHASYLELRGHGRRLYPPGWPDIGRALVRLRDAFSIVFSNLRQQRRRHELAAGLAISIVGWQWKWRWHGETAQLRPLRPIVCRLLYSAQPIPGFVLERTARYWGWERNWWWLESMPPLPTQIRDKLKAELNRSVLPDRTVEGLLIDAIHEVARDPKRGVSRDCLTISLVPARDPLVVVRYNPLPIARTASVETARVKGSPLPESHTGWIVTPGMTEPPRLLLLTEDFSRRAQSGWLGIGFEGPKGQGEISAQVALPSRR